MIGVIFVLDYDSVIVHWKWFKVTWDQEMKQPGRVDPKAMKYTPKIVVQTNNYDTTRTVK